MGHPQVGKEQGDTRLHMWELSPHEKIRLGKSYCLLLVNEPQFPPDPQDPHPAACTCLSPCPHRQSLSVEMKEHLPMCPAHGAWSPDTGSPVGLA